MFEKRKSPGYLANFAARVFASHLRDQVAPLGLAPAQFMVLLELWDEDGLTQKQLFERLGLAWRKPAEQVERIVVLEVSSSPSAHRVQFAPV